MVLATSELKKINFENIFEFDIQGASIDLAIDNVVKVPKKGKKIDLENFDGDELFDKIELSKEFYLKPNSFIYASTLEKIEIPLNMCGIVLPRSQLARIGLILPSSMFANPGYKGHLPIIIHNHSPFEVKIPPYFRVAQLLLLELKGEAIEYGSNKLHKYQNEERIKEPKFDDFKKILEWM